MIVGRSGELRQLAAAWTRVVTTPHRSGTVVVTGATGTGKSLLVATALDRFVPRPRVVLSGTARVHSPAPYDWLAAVLSADPGVSAQTWEPGVPADALAWLGQMPIPSDGAGSTSRERYTPETLLRMAVRVVRGMVGDGPTVLVVEDLHALDPASLNLVAELAVAPGLPALLLATSRPTAEGDIASRTLARLSGAPRASRVHLNPLTADEVAGLVARRYGDVPGSVVEAVVRRTGGNPYQVIELLATHPDPVQLIPGPIVELTVRETEVLSCLVGGMSNKQIARSLGISIRTVTVHVSNLLRKTGSASRTEAALWAVRRQPADSAR